MVIETPLMEEILRGGKGSGHHGHGGLKGVHGGSAPSGDTIDNHPSREISGRKEMQLEIIRRMREEFPDAYTKIETWQINDVPDPKGWITPSGDVYRLELHTHRTSAMELLGEQFDGDFAFGEMMAYGFARLLKAGADIGIQVKPNMSNQLYRAILDVFWAYPENDVLIDYYNNPEGRLITEEEEFIRSQSVYRVVERGGKGSGHHGHGGLPGVWGGSTSSSIFIGVPADVLEPGEEAVNMSNRQPSGAPIRGTAIAWDDDRIPDVVYHMTTNLPAIQKAGEISARGEGGLGGDTADQIVSMTISEDIAYQLVDDMKLAIHAAVTLHPTEPDYEDKEGRKRWSEEEVIPFLDAVSQAEGWTFSESTVWSDDWSLPDYMRLYFWTREDNTGKRNPLIYTSPENLIQINPRWVGIVAVPRENLDTGALLTDFDLGKNSLEEVRLYGDVPLENADFIERGGKGSGHHGHGGLKGVHGGSSSGGLPNRTDPKTEYETDFLDNMRQMARFMGQRAPIRLDFPSLYHLVLEFGQFFDAPETDELPDFCDRQTPQLCFENAFHAMLDSPGDDYTYVEGFAITEIAPFPVAHAWIVDKEGQVIDPTWKDRGVAYFGIPFTRKAVTQSIVKNKVYGLLPTELHVNTEFLEGGIPEEFIQRGGVGSGHHGHSGLPGVHGGSRPDDYSSATADKKSPKDFDAKEISKLLVQQAREEGADSPLTIANFLEIKEENKMYGMGLFKFWIAPDGTMTYVTDEHSETATISFLEMGYFPEQLKPDHVTQSANSDFGNWNVVQFMKELGFVRATYFAERDELIFEFFHRMKRPQKEVVQDLVFGLGIEEFSYEYDKRDGTYFSGVEETPDEFGKIAGITFRGGKGSGHHGHGGLPGVHGGSTPSGSNFVERFPYSDTLGREHFEGLLPDSHQKAIEDFRNKHDDLTERERAVLLDRNNKRVLEAAGSAKSVYIDEDEAHVKGYLGTLIHNHPNDVPFSRGDISAMFLWKINSTYVLTAHHLFEIFVRRESGGFLPGGYHKFDRKLVDLIEGHMRNGDHKVIAYHKAYRELDNQLDWFTYRVYDVRQTFWGR